MPPHKSTLPKPPQPSRTTFDPWNSSSTGHQRAENQLAGSTSWRDSRKYKLSHQFRDTSGGGGSQHLSDLVGAGSENFGRDGRKQNGDWEVGAPGLRDAGWQDIRGLLRGDKSAKESTSSITSAKPGSDRGDEAKTVSVTANPAAVASKQRLFSGLTVFINGSTAPLVGDHKLKHLLAQHGANVSLGLGRRTVTHVILGESRESAGGAKGLAATKIQKEATRIGGKGVKYVNVGWVLESIEAGKRLPEARFSALNLNSKGTSGVYGMFKKDSKKAVTDSSALPEL